MTVASLPRGRVAGINAGTDVATESTSASDCCGRTEPIECTVGTGLTGILLMRACACWRGDGRLTVSALGLARIAGVDEAGVRAGVLFEGTARITDAAVVLAAGTFFGGLVCGLVVGVVTLMGTTFLGPYGSAVAGRLISGRFGRRTGPAVIVRFEEDGWLSLGLDRPDVGLTAPAGRIGFLADAASTLGNADCAELGLSGRPFCRAARL